MPEHVSAIRLDPLAARRDIPILKRTLENGKSLVYLDNASTTQKPQAVIDAISDFYTQTNANIHRSVYSLANESTTAYENVRDFVKDIFNAPDRDHVVFTSGTTESVNLVAHSWGANNLDSNDVVLLTEMEHHANLVPWQMLADIKGFELRFIPVDKETLTLDLTSIDKLMKGVSFVGIIHTSNVLGIRNPIERIVEIGRKNGARVLIDSAQGCPHEMIDIQEIGCDFLVMSAHKMCGPTGVGCLILNNGVMDEMKPFLGGGNMIQEVWLQKSTFAEGSQRFEAGTPKIAEVIGWGAAIKWIRNWRMDSIHKHCLDLARYTVRGLQEIVPNIKIFGRHEFDDSSGIVSFLHPSIHASDLSTLLDMYGVAVRTGHHCAQPLMRKLGVSATSRASFYLYNTIDDANIFLEAIKSLSERFS